MSRVGSRTTDEEARMSLLRRVIGGVLRRLRVRQGRTLREVAEVAGVSVPYLSEVERGRKEASSEVLAAICRALGIRLSDLLEEARDDLRRVEPRTPVMPPRVPTGRRVLPTGPRPAPAASRPTPVTRPAAGGSTCPSNRVPNARAAVGRRPAGTTGTGSFGRSRPVRSGVGQHRVLLVAGRSPRC
ncbi:helix-turn-helix domain-containing protein [Micromonospora sagamiensis]